MSTVHSAQPTSYTHTLRITFAYDGPKLEIKRVQRVAMLAPAAPPTSPAENQTGYWLEVCDREGALLYHRPMHDPLHRYFHCGCFRASFTCRMRALNNPFCGVCQKVISDTLQPFLPTETT
jgi:hypothetical protein